jgi:AraC-like DNA-binding protein
MLSTAFRRVTGASPKQFRDSAHYVPTTGVEPALPDIAARVTK